MGTWTSLLLGNFCNLQPPWPPPMVPISCFGWNATMKDIRFKLVWMLIILMGCYSYAMELNPWKWSNLSTSGPMASYYLLSLFPALGRNNKKVMQEHQEYPFPKIYWEYYNPFIGNIWSKKYTHSFGTIFKWYDLYIDINCDVGRAIGNEAQLMPLISSCNIACGAIAGDKRDQDLQDSPSGQHHQKS